MIGSSLFVLTLVIFNMLEEYDFPPDKGIVFHWYRYSAHYARIHCLADLSFVPVFYWGEDNYNLFHKGADSISTSEVVYGASLRSREAEQVDGTRLGFGYELKFRVTNYKLIRFLVEADLQGLAPILGVKNFLEFKEKQEWYKPQLATVRKLS